VSPAYGDDGPGRDDDALIEQLSTMAGLVVPAEDYPALVTLLREQAARIGVLTAAELETDWTVDSGAASFDPRWHGRDL
jgi:hypothetical protein